MSEESQEAQGVWKGLGGGSWKISLGWGCRRSCGFNSAKEGKREANPQKGSLGLVTHFHADFSAQFPPGRPQVEHQRGM